MEGKKKRGAERLWRGFAAITASITVLALVGGTVVNSFRTDIDKFLGTSSTKLVTAEEDLDDLYTYQSDYANTTELVQAIQDLGERMSEEGSVLLKNNGALPLTAEEKGKVSLLGFSSYYPVRGGDMGSSLTPNEGTDADTVDFVQALQAKGFTINPDLQALYSSLESYFVTEVESWGRVLRYTNITSPATTGVFASKEPSQEIMASTDADWKNSLVDNNVLIVTIARSSGENRTYLPGEAGVDASQGLNQTDPLGLSDDERDLIQAAIDAKNANGGKVIVVINACNTMEIGEIAENEGVDAILQVGLPGGYGFYGVADILSGDANPSGHLSDTYVTKNAMAPASQNYGNYPWANADAGNYVNVNSALVEAENIYIGYKYYETRYADVVMGKGNAASTVGSSTGSAWTYEDEVVYPFGYGLSYTTFEQKLDSVEVDLAAGTVTAKVTVTNTGDVAGKDVVQLYVSAPYTEYDIANGVEKAGVQLLDFAKTSELAPGASETVEIVADAQYMASWDSNADNAIGTKGCYILDDGTYYFAIGNGSHAAMINILAAQGFETDNYLTEANADNVGTWTLGEFDNETFARSKNGTPVENHLEDADLNYWIEGAVTYLTRNDWEGTFPKTYENLTYTDEMLEYLDNDIYQITENGDPASVVFGADNGLTLSDLKGVSDLSDERWGLLMDQITLEEGMIRTAFGGTSTKAIPSIGSPETIQNDGPNGIYSYPLGQYATIDASLNDPCTITETDKNFNYRAGVMGNATIIASTFNKELAEEYGEVMGNYSLWANLTIYWGAATNIHRSCYNARNHEYYSEDAQLSNYMAANFIKGGNKYGLINAVKHYAFNDTEINRSGVSVFVTEQQARENELRCYQSSIEDEHALGVMTAFNRVGVTQSNAHTGIMIDILREEWGFMGLMSEDFIQDPVFVHLKEAVMNGITMLCKTGDNTIEAVVEWEPYWNPTDVSKDATLSAAIKQAMTWQAYALANSNAMDGYASSTTIVTVKTWYDYAILAAQIAFAALTLLNLVLYFRARGKKEA